MARKFWTFILSVAICLQIAVPANAVQQDGQSQLSAKEKIDSSVYLEEKNADGKRLICIVRDELDYEQIDKKVSEKMALDSAVLSELNSEAVAAEKKDDFFAQRRETIKSEYTSKNDDFMSEYNIAAEDTEYIGEYTSTIILYATDEEIERYAADSSVVSIMPFENTIQQSHMKVASEQVQADSGTGTKGMGYSNSYGTGYKGDGIKIGIIEAEQGRYDPSCPHLSGADIEFLYTTDANGNQIIPVIGEHATLVTSIIVGQKVTVGTVSYEGIVPNATVYQTSISTSCDVLRAINMLAGKGVSVINYSGGVKNGDKTYSTFDAEVDRLVKVLGVSVIISAGNEKVSGDVTSPGKAYNAICVGNASTETTMGIPSPTPYSMASSSSYDEDSFLANKPDVVAPGTNIHYVSSGTTVLYKSGTSFAAPIVAGIVAQLHQASSAVKWNPVATKSLILVGAAPSKVAIADNDTVDSNAYIRERSGAGLVNAVKTMDTALLYQYTAYTFNLSTISIPTTRTRTVSLQEGQKIRIALAFEKVDVSADSSDVLTAAYGNNINLTLADPNGVQVAYSTSSINNTEIIEYSAGTSGTYTITLTFAAKNSSSSQTLNAAMSWRIIDGAVRLALDANGGTCSTTGMYVYPGESYGLLPTPTCSGYTFVGWFPEEFMEGTEVTSDTIVTNTENHTLYAHWGSRFKITNIGANKCLNIYGDNVTVLSNNQNVTLWSDSGTNEQKWLIAGSGTQKYIRSVIDKRYGLNVYRSGSPYNCDVYPIIGNEQDAQIDMVYATNGYKIKLHNYDLYLTAGSSVDGANVYWAADNGSDYQRWSLELLS